MNKFRSDFALAAFSQEGTAARQAFDQHCNKLNVPPTAHNANDWAETVPIRLTHFTPKNKECWKWTFMIPIRTCSGIQETIDGKFVLCEPPTTMWTGSALFPSFPDRKSAVDWANQHLENDWIETK